MKRQRNTTQMNNGAVINSEAVAKGLSFEIDGVKIDVLQTWDPADGFSNINDTSLVLRFHICISPWFQPTLIYRVPDVSKV